MRTRPGAAGGGPWAVSRSGGGGGGARGHGCGACGCRCLLVPLWSVCRRKENYHLLIKASVPQTLPKAPFSLFRYNYYEIWYQNTVLEPHATRTQPSGFICPATSHINLGSASALLLHWTPYIELNDGMKSHRMDLSILSIGLILIQEEISVTATTTTNLIRQQQPEFAKNLQGHNVCAIMN